VAIPTQR
jgi:ankyrin repeat protein